MDHMRGKQRNAGMAVLTIVPIEERRAETATIVKRAEAFRKLRGIFEGFELGLGKRIVVADVRTAMRLGNAEICEQKSNGL